MYIVLFTSLTLHFIVISSFFIFSAIPNDQWNVIREMLTSIGNSHPAISSFLQTQVRPRSNPRSSSCKPFAFPIHWNRPFLWGTQVDGVTSSICAAHSASYCPCVVIFETDIGKKITTNRSKSPKIPATRPPILYKLPQSIVRPLSTHRTYFKPKNVH